MSSSNKNQFSQKISKEFFLNTVEMKYSYNFKWLEGQLFNIHKILLPCKN